MTLQNTLQFWENFYTNYLVAPSRVFGHHCVLNSGQPKKV